MRGCTNSSADFILRNNALGNEIARGLPVLLTMIIKIRHSTTYTYDEPVRYGLQRLRIVPISGPTQKVRSWKLDIDGASEEVRYSDQFANDTRLLSVDGDRNRIEIVAEGEGRDARTALAVFRQAVWFRATVAVRPRDRPDTPGRGRCRPDGKTFRAARKSTGCMG